MNTYIHTYISKTYCFSHTLKNLWKPALCLSFNISTSLLPGNDMVPTFMRLPWGLRREKASKALSLSSLWNQLEVQGFRTVTPKYATFAPWLFKLKKKQMTRQYRKSSLLTPQVPKIYPLVKELYTYKGICTRKRTTKTTLIFWETFPCNTRQRLFTRHSHSPSRSLLYTPQFPEFPDLHSFL
jgi:hypothetical protein